MDGEEIKKPASLADLRIPNVDAQIRQAFMASECMREQGITIPPITTRQLPSAGFSIDEVMKGINTLHDTMKTHRASEAERIAKASTLHGMRIIQSDMVGPNEIAFLVGGEVMARIINLGKENGVDNAGGGPKGD